MPGFDASLPDRIAAHLESQRLALAESWNQCFNGLQYQLLPRMPEALDLAAVLTRLQQPGLVTLFEAGGTGAAVLIPESCGLPDWYQTPGDSQKSRLDTLAMEWSLNLWPDDCNVQKSGSLAVPDLAAYLQESQPNPDAVLVSIEVQDQSSQPVGSFDLVWPLVHCVWPSEPATPAVDTATPVPAGEPLPAAASPVSRRPAKPRGPDPLARLRNLPVQVSVRLAEKKITLSQLLAITPGALMTFNKPCDDLLDLYVNNSLYCRGEAVKIGESFGLKIDEVGVQVERESKLLQR